MRLARRLAIALAVLFVLSIVLRAMGSSEPEIADGSTLVVEVRGSYVEAAAPPLAARLPIDTIIGLALAVSVASRRITSDASDEPPPVSMRNTTAATLGSSRAWRSALATV